MDKEKQKNEINTKLCGLKFVNFLTNQDYLSFSLQKRPSEKKKSLRGTTIMSLGRQLLQL